MNRERSARKIGRSPVYLRSTTGRYVVMGILQETFWNATGIMIIIRVFGYGDGAPVIIVFQRELVILLRITGEITVLLDWIRS